MPCFALSRILCAHKKFKTLGFICYDILFTKYIKNKDNSKTSNSSIIFLKIENNCNLF